MAAAVHAVALTGCGEDSSPPAPFLRIESPSDGDQLSGEAPLVLAYELPDSVEVMEIGVDGDVRPMRSLFPDIALQTTSYPDGEHTITARLMDVNGQLWEDTVTVSFDNPDHELLSNEFSEPKYRAGDRVELLLSYSTDVELAVDFSALDAAFDAADVTLEQRGPGEYFAAYTLSPSSTAEDGAYEVGVTAVAANGDETIDRLPIDIETTPELPIEVAGAVFVPGPVTATDAEPPSDLEVTEVSGDLNILTGGTAQMKVSWAQDENDPVTHVQVSADGFNGQYVLPVEPQSGSTGEATLELRLPAMKPGFEGGEIDVQASVANASGAAAPANQKVNTIPVAGGGIQLTLEWGTPADLDLSVITPANNLLDFENPSVDGGVLDLDSNALCETTNVNKENVAWREGTEPQGSYQVRVNLFEACGGAETAWKITAQYCGKVETFTGSLGPGNEDMSGTGQLVTTLMVNCDQVVQGTVTYAKRKSSSPTKKASSTSFVTVPNAPIRAVTEATPPVTLAEGVTDASGKYKLAFSNPSAANWHVEVDSSWVDPGTQAVRAFVHEPGTTDPYRFESAVVMATGARATRTENLKIRVQDQSGAWNIRDIARRGFEWVKTNTSAAQAASLPDLPIEWKSGVTPPGGTSYFQGGALFILSDPADTDEFDDAVLAHEFMHYVVNTLSQPGPGGPHSGRVAPALAWSEGIATGFGLDVIKAIHYRDESQGAVMAIDVESLAAAHTGTDGNSRTGNIDEFTISAFSHDLLDGKNETHDKLAERGPTFKTAFDHFKGAAFVDRDGNGADLSDFVDGFRSRNLGGQDGQLKCLADKLSFPYDFLAETVCPP